MILALAAPRAGAQSSGAQSSEVGLPLLRAIEPQEYDGDLQVFDVAQGPDGILHLASPGELAVLHYDGERWTRTRTGAPVLSLDVDSAGRVWVGCGAEFGFLQDAEDGTFVSLAGRLDDQEGSPPSYISTLCTARGVFFLASELLALWDGGELTTWHAPEGGGFMDVEALGEDIFVLEGSRGLHLLVDGELVESDAFASREALFDALFSDGEQLLGVRLDPDGLHWIRTGDVSESTLVVPELQRGPTYVSDVVVTAEGTMVVACASGILLVDSAGSFQAWLDDDRGLPNSLVYSLELDREGAVWAALAYGIARIDPSPAVSFFGEQLGLEGSPISFVRHEGVAYCGTFEGLFRLVSDSGRARFERVTEVPALTVWDLEATPHGLLIGTELGLLHLEGQRIVRISPEQPVALASLAVPDGAFDAPESVAVAGFDALWEMQWQEEGGWKLGSPFPVSWSTASIFVVERGLWLHSADNELFYLPREDGFGPAQRVPGTWLGVSQGSTGILAWNDDELVHLPGSGDAGPADTSPDARLGQTLGWAARRDVSRRVVPVVDAEERLWLLDRNSLVRLERSAGGAHRPLSDVTWSSSFDLDGVYFDEFEPAVAWLPTRGGIVRLDTDRLRPRQASNPHVSSFVLAEGEDIARLPAGATLAARAGIRVEVAAGTFDGVVPSYRYRLDGLEHEWTPWTTQAIKEYSNLPGGEYELYIEARDPGRRLGLSSIAFAVHPPWYATWPAFLAGLTLLGLSGFGFVRWRSRRLRRENERLGRMVADRTADLAAQRTREREMEERLREVERFESLGAMAGGIAHDFNNYLTSILGNAELALGEEADRERREEYLRNVTTISRQAAELCSGLLSLTDGAPPATAPIELSELARSMESLLRTSVGDRAELRLQLSTDLPLLAGDLGQLRRALVNLALNAAEACEEANVIHVRTGVLQCSAADLERMVSAAPRAPGRYAYVEVEDEGVGLDRESLHRVFDPFYSTKFVGRGLGLSTVFRILALHGGAIDIRSELGRGTTVRLLFPEASEISVAPSPSPAGAPRARLSGHVLVVDDDARIRELVTDFCQRLGLQVSRAAGGQEALRILARSGHGIGALMLDLSMPGMGGLEVLREVRASRRDMPVLLVSGYADTVPSASLDERTRFLAKPFSFREFAGLIEDMVQRASA